MIYLLPFISALVGWFTNFIAVKMLFYPRNKVRILFFDIQGVFPKRQKVVAEKIGKMVAEELLSFGDLKQKITSPENINKVTVLIEEKIDDYLTNKFPRNYPITSLFFNKQRQAKVKAELVEEVERMAPELIDSYMDNLEQMIDIEYMISEKVSELSPEKLERLIMGILKKEFVFIEWIGALIGFLIGIMQIFIAKM
jgi:uncharacterized membrane protein YheB (UPF0754 family)